ncbi:helix-turn-helix domain-containing protein [Crossiella sp. SN42]|uniref:helix-turn-helix domain-containing protein n=1 Tax=Crossiella sp. SN42 TaxID=2944808 RepID=UPI00207CD1DB|nr:helix-turn-helix domain-containing protein [Crossiella sp. SN42]MCO1582174.1 helix-turn-helix domain-containing protein [Crossiella sp. SN42]
MSTHPLSSVAASAGGNPIKLLYRIDEAIAVLGLGKTALYELIRSGRLKSVQEGRARLIPARAIQEYVALLEREAGVTYGKTA